MGGKTWSREEEVYFWTHVIPNSPARVNTILRPEKEWDVLADEMTGAMGSKARRVYTKLGLCTLASFFGHFHAILLACSLSSPLLPLQLPVGKLLHPVNGAPDEVS